MRVGRLEIGPRVDTTVPAVDGPAQTGGRRPARVIGVDDQSVLAAPHVDRHALGGRQARGQPAAVERHLVDPQGRDVDEAPRRTGRPQLQRGHGADLGALLDRREVEGDVVPVGDDQVTATDESLGAPDDAYTTRRLDSGEEYRIVKVFYDPRRLARRLAALGWQIETRVTGRFFFVGHGGPAQTRRSDRRAR